MRDFVGGLFMVAFLSFAMGMGLTISLTFARYPRNWALALWLVIGSLTGGGILLLVVPLWIAILALLIGLALAVHVVLDSE